MQEKRTGPISCDFQMDDPIHGGSTPCNCKWRDYVKKCLLPEQGQYGSVSLIYHTRNPDLLYIDKKLPVPEFSIGKINGDFTNVRKKFNSDNDYNKWLYYQREKDCLLKLSHENHPNIVRRFHAFVKIDYLDRKYLHLVMEYCQGGSLREAMVEHLNNGNKFDERNQVGTN